MPLKFLELAIAAPEVLESYQFYERLGFTPATTADVWSHRYAVLCDGRAALALHQREFTSPAIRFVQPDLQAHLAEIERLGAALESVQLDEEHFNEANFRDPDGHLITLLEARTFSAPETQAASVCGWFEELALPVRDLNLAQRFWEQLGFVAVGEETDPAPHLALTSDHLDIGLYPGPALGAPALRFSVDDLAATATQLGARGIAGARPPAALASEQSLLLVAPEGTRLILTGPTA
jgi:catechol 2,3-dioxygenase-like lactoylglutathione lyase family enzyme